MKSTELRPRLIMAFAVMLVLTKGLAQDLAIEKMTLSYEVL